MRDSPITANFNAGPFRNERRRSPGYRCDSTTRTFGRVGRLLSLSHPAGRLRGKGKKNCAFKRVRRQSTLTTSVCTELICCQLFVFVLNYESVARSRCLLYVEGIIETDRPISAAKPVLRDKSRKAYKDRNEISMG